MKIAKIDYRSKTASKEFAKSLSETGFAVIENHNITTDLLNETYKQWAHFFRDIGKHDYTFKPKSQTGYFPFKSENAKDSPIKDLKEFYHTYSSNDLPSNIEQESTIKIRNKLFAMALNLLQWLDRETPESIRNTYSSTLSSMAVGGNTLFRILHYPPLPADAEVGAVRAAAHEDINLITLLPAATQAGLEVKDINGNWHAIDSDPGNIIVNVGDMLQLASQGYYKSTTHRVVNPIGEEAKNSRYSMPLFVHPRSEVMLSPEKSAEQYLNERLKELGLIK